MIDLDWIRRLIDMVDGSGIDSLEISRFGTRVRIAKSPPVTVSSSMAGPAVSPPVSAPVGASAPDSGPRATGEAQGEAEQEPESDLAEVTSPMVGTFYRAPAPDAPPYVEVGDRVTKGQTLCILEAMKLMNELESEVSGTIREICVDNAEPVEFGQVLFRIDPA
jgi:acetyl-CoA carboxylase biotin carboxyl carrier protein